MVILILKSLCSHCSAHVQEEVQEEVGGFPVVVTAPVFSLRGTRVLVKGEVEEDQLLCAWEDLKVWRLAGRNPFSQRVGVLVSEDSQSLLSASRSASIFNILQILRYLTCCPVQALEAEGAVLGWEGMGSSSLSDFFVTPSWLSSLSMWTKHIKELEDYGFGRDARNRPPPPELDLASLALDSGSEAQRPKDVNPGDDHHQV